MRPREIPGFASCKRPAVGFFPARLITEHLALRSVQKLGQLRDIGDRCIGRSHGVDCSVKIWRPAHQCVCWDAAQFDRDVEALKAKNI